MSKAGASHDVSPEKQEFLDQMKRRRERRERNKREGEPSFWQSVGAMGMVGWAVALPTALGVLLGRWLDGRLEAGHVFMVFFMLVGLAIGCVTAWRAVSEHR